MKICCKYSSKNKNKIVEAISQKAGEKDKNTENRRTKTKIKRSAQQIQHWANKIFRRNKRGNREWKEIIKDISGENQRA